MYPQIRTFASYDSVMS